MHVDSDDDCCGDFEERKVSTPRTVKESWRNPCTRYLVPRSDAPGVWTDGRVVGASPSSSASFGNLENLEFHIIIFCGN